jgi:hypothetical protein
MSIPFRPGGFPATLAPGTDHASRHASDVDRRLDRRSHHPCGPAHDRPTKAAIEAAHCPFESDPAVPAHPDHTPAPLGLALGLDGWVG